MKPEDLALGRQVVGPPDARDLGTESGHVVRPVVGLRDPVSTGSQPKLPGVFSGICARGRALTTGGTKKTEVLPVRRSTRTTSLAPASATSTLEVSART
jgi:hypothetical protein